MELNGPIVCAGRSGTALLVVMLNRDPESAVHLESQFFDLLVQFGGRSAVITGSCASLDTFLQAVLG